MILEKLSSPRKSIHNPLKKGKQTRPDKTGNMKVGGVRRTEGEDKGRRAGGGELEATG